MEKLKMSHIVKYI